MKPTVLSICNDALSECGSPRIVSLDGDSKGAKLCKQHYAQERNKLLRSHNWVWARGRAVLPRLQESPEFGWAYKHLLPTDCIRVLDVDGCDDYEREGEYILSDSETLKIIYVKEIQDPTKFDETFADTLGLCLAAKICFALTQSNKRQEVLDKKAEEALTMARHYDSAEDAPIFVDSDDYINARS